MGRKKSVVAEAAVAVNQTPATKILAYKGMDENFACRGHQYAVGQSYEVAGTIKACSNGFHACEYPLSVFDYYPPANNRFALVELEGDVDVENDKTAARKIIVIRELSVRDMAEAAVEYTKARTTSEKPNFNDVDRGAATASGTRGAATASGTQGAATASGEQGAATASGYGGAATASGEQGAATASGYGGAATASGVGGAATASGVGGAATASGWKGAATASGYGGAATASGYGGAATASGDRGAATASGIRGAATASGVGGAATASGTQGAATASGYGGAATASGYGGAATASGYDGKVRGKDGCALFLVERDNNYDIVAVWAGIAGRDGIKADTFYHLVDAKPVEIV
jgi:hypothetical protein